MGAVGWFSRKRGRAAGGGREAAMEPATVAHLEDFVATRRGVEAFIELPTTMTRATLLLIAFDGEWTRRSVASVEWARHFAARHGLPAYDAGVVGYPQRMRDYNARRRSAG
ncbi:hypothetical protein [Propionicimonas sp. T2.31MG-18]|uniref:hypothetical protein n=1 Tax=Propionicimonas sp. T2.31MG-18 TaxID=3157620 RepID=UPI0036703538